MSKYGRKLLMLGTSRNTKGGVASVVKIYEAYGLFDKWPIAYLATHVDGGYARKLRVAVTSLVSYLFWLFKNPNGLLHVHCASRASFWRKSFFILPAARLNRPVIFHLHGAQFMQFYENECGPLRKRLVRHTLASCTTIIVLSESWRKAIESITTAVKVEVIANPVLTFCDSATNTSRDESTLLFLGRMGERKGIFVLLDAIAEISDKYPNIRLICGGDGDLQQVRQRIKELDIEENVEVLGWVGEKQRTALYRKATILVLPSFAEGLPMSVLEAMSAGMPIVSTPVGGIPEAVHNGEQGYLVPPGDPAELANAICRLLDDETLRTAMGEQSRAAFHEKFDARVVIPRLESIYRHLGLIPQGND